MPKIKTRNANEPAYGPVKIGAPMNAMNTSQTVVTSNENGNGNGNGNVSPDASGLHAISCTQVAAKRGIHGLSPCCTLCHGRDGLQNVYVDNVLMALCCTAITEIVLRWPSAIRYAAK